MAKTLVDCEPFLGRPWQISIADQEWEKEEVYRLRYDIFARENGYGVGANDGTEGRDVDNYDGWCRHLMLRDEAKGELIGTYRLIPGPLAIAHGGFYSGEEFDLSPLAPIAPKILEIGRTCVAPAYRNGLAMQLLWYGLETVLKQEQLTYLLGCGSFTLDRDEDLDALYGYVSRHHQHPTWMCRPVARCRTRETRPPEALPADLTAPGGAGEKLVPPLIRGYFKMGASCIGTPAWDPAFRSYDLLLLFARDSTNDYCGNFLSRMARQLKLAARRSGSGEIDVEALMAAGAGAAVRA